MVWRCLSDDGRDTTDAVMMVRALAEELQPRVDGQLHAQEVINVCLHSDRPGLAKNPDNSAVLVRVATEVRVGVEVQSKRKGAGLIELTSRTLAKERGVNVGCGTGAGQMLKCTHPQLCLHYYTPVTIPTSYHNSPYLSLTPSWRCRRKTTPTKTTKGAGRAAQRTMFSTSAPGAAALYVYQGVCFSSRPDDLITVTYQSTFQVARVRAREF